MPKTIIAALDGSEFAERAMVPAMMLSEHTGAALVPAMSRLGGASEPERYLQEAAARAGAVVDHTVVFEDQLAATAIPLLADTEPDAMICMATHARSGPSQMVFGSIAEAVLGNSDVPLVLIGPAVEGTAGSGFRELVVCLDGSDAAASILPVATDLARDLDLSLWLVDVIDPDHRIDAGSKIADDSYEAAPLARVAHELQRTKGTSANWETLHGRDPAAAIVEFAATFHAPLIAMTTHGRSGLSRVIAGSVTMAVVRQASCPVLVTRAAHLC